VLAGETDVLRIFADLSALSRNRRVSNGTGALASDDLRRGRRAARNPQEYLTPICARVTPRRRGCPVVPDPAAAGLAHYGVADLEPSADPGPRCTGCPAHRRAVAHAPVLASCCQFWRGSWTRRSEWFAVRRCQISMESAREMDWISGTARIIEFTQDGGEINVVVTGINVGAQPYWNARPPC